VTCQNAVSSCSKRECVHFCLVVIIISLDIPSPIQFALPTFTSSSSSTSSPHIFYNANTIPTVPECHEQKPRVYYLQTEREQLFCFHLGHFRQVNQGSSLNFRLSVAKFLAYVSTPRWRRTNLAQLPTAKQNRNNQR
jgi:hypothetical protein